MSAIAVARDVLRGQRQTTAPVRLSRHVHLRAVRRSGSRPSRRRLPEELRRALARTRRLGRNPENGAIAVLAIYRERALVAMLQKRAA